MRDSHAVLSSAPAATLPIHSSHLDCTRHAPSMSAAAVVPLAMAAPTRKLFTLVLLTKDKPLSVITPSTLPSPVPSAAVASPVPSSSFALSTSAYSSVLLGLKKRGFGAGKWNGFGGKVEQGESIRTAAIREMKEEAGIESVDERDRSERAGLDGDAPELT
jgi:hypothetical protein